MIDNFALAITHGLLLLFTLRLIGRQDLDKETPKDDDASSAAAPSRKSWLNRENA